MRMHLSKGIFETFREKNLRYSQVVPFSMFEEKNTGTNLPAQIDIYSTEGMSYEFLFVTKGGGSANKTFLYQQTKSLLNEESLIKFVKEKIKGTWNIRMSSLSSGSCNRRYISRGDTENCKRGLCRLSRSSSAYRKCCRTELSGILNGKRKLKRSVMNMESVPSSEENISSTMSE